jgi:hypothetical protein
MPAAFYLGSGLATLVLCVGRSYQLTTRAMRSDGVARGTTESLRYICVVAAAFTVPYLATDLLLLLLIFLIVCLIS